MDDAWSALFVFLWHTDDRDSLINWFPVIMVVHKKDVDASRKCVKVNQRMPKEKGRNQKIAKHALMLWKNG